MALAIFVITLLGDAALLGGAAVDHDGDFVVTWMSLSQEYRIAITMCRQESLDVSA